MQMKPSGKGSGPPPAVKKLLSMFGSQREEDRMVGYLSFLKVGPQLLRFLPGGRQPSPARIMGPWLACQCCAHKRNLFASWPPC